MEIEIRPVRPGDGPGCARVWREAGEYFVSLSPDIFQVPDDDGLADWFEGLHDRYAGDRGQLRLVAVVADDIAGVLSASMYDPLDSELAGRQLQADFSRRRGHVDALAVATRWRRSGVGTALMRRAEDWARQAGAEVITLETEISNPMSMPFYESRMGFVRQAVTFRKSLS